MATAPRLQSVVATANPLPAISIIATVLNEVESIDSLVRSLLRQTLPPAEIVIVDGGSADGTWEKLRELASGSAQLRVIRDESCSLKNSPGPIARGRNVAISAAVGDIIACCDAGCSYGNQWLERLTLPIIRSEAEYVLGGSYIDTAKATAWDLASAPMMGISLSGEGVRKSCTARSMAFTKSLWERAGRFPETTLLGEDTLFDAAAQRITSPAYSDSAMAVYAPNFNLPAALATLARYSAADGALGLRKARFGRMSLRCALQSGALLAIGWSRWPLMVAAVVELYAAFERDRTVLKLRHWRGFLPRLIFSACVPWVSVAKYIQGRISKSSPVNDQNELNR